MSISVNHSFIKTVRKTNNLKKMYFIVRAQI